VNPKEAIVTYRTGDTAILNEMPYEDPLSASGNVSHSFCKLI
jgi:hypothetical protein